MGVLQGGRVGAGLGVKGLTPVEICQRTAALVLGGHADTLDWPQMLSRLSISPVSFWYRRRTPARTARWMLAIAVVFTVAGEICRALCANSERIYGSW
jgi:hypothetical protein